MSAAADQAGRVVSHYRILHRLGSGGMGVVYKALDIDLGRVVAIKFLNSQAADALPRLIQEARAISALNHPNIATLHEVNLSEGDPFLVFEYLPGGSLHSRIRAQQRMGLQLPLAEILHHARQITAALSHAHRHGVIHRDVKSANALFSEEGILKITDFGVAKLDGAHQLTSPGTTVGTVSYMSPEQAEGKDVDGRSDIFSLGVMLHEMATGKLPFAGPSDPAILYQIVHAPAPAIRQFRQDLPAAFEQILAKALEKSPDKRYQSMQEMSAELHALARSAKLDAPEPDEDAATATLPALSPRSRWRLGAQRQWFAAVFLLLLLMALSAMLRDWLRSERLPAEKQLVVLPFANLGGGQANQLFCDGLTESLTASLSRLEQFQGSLRVVPPEDVRKQPIASPHAARRILGANLVVNGSIERSGDRLQVMIELVDAGSGRRVRRETTTLGLSGLAGIEPWILERSIRMLELTLEPRVRSLLLAAQTAAPGAFDFYLQGLGYLRRYDMPENLNNAAALLEKAIHEDPRYAPAHAALGETFWRKYRGTKEQQWLERAWSSSRRAEELNPQSAAVQVTLGCILGGRGRLPEALRAFERALELDPLSAEAYGALAVAYDSQGRYRDAEATYRKSIELRPGYWSGYNNLGAFYWSRGSYAQAEKQFLRVIELTPDNIMGHKNLGALYIFMGRYEDATARLERSLALGPTATAYSNLGSVYFFSGRYGQAVPMMEKAAQQNPADPVMWGNLADAYRWAPGRAESAAEAYRRAIELGERLLRLNPDDAQILSSLAVYHAKLGEDSQALAAIARATRLAGRNGSILFKSALVYELTRRRERAFSSLAAALEAGYSVEEARREPELAGLRRDPRCTPLLMRKAAERHPASAPN